MLHKLTLVLLAVSLSGMALAGQPLSPRTPFSLQATSVRPCAFGDWFPDLDSRFETFDQHDYTLADAQSLDEILTQQILVATDASSLKEAFAKATNNGVISTVSFSSPVLPADSYTAVYSDQNDATTGAIFDTDEVTPLARIVDSGIVDCTLSAP